MINSIEKIFAKADLQYDKFWLHNNHYIVTQNKQYNEDMYKGCNILIDLFCLQQMKEVAFAITEDYDYDIRTSIYCYLDIVKELEIDFNLFVLMAGEDYINSDYYNVDFEDCEENQINILYYLLKINYYKIVQILTTHYKDKQKLLLTIIEPFFQNYEIIAREIETLEDMFDYPEVVKMHTWASDGFDISGNL